ncbi:MAG TPA: ABC transporter substrate-binding protein [Stellaceae bacterium]|nr:ABC transporter substrate-binding protein [Stellaceae bacterium]
MSWLSLVSPARVLTLVLTLWSGSALAQSGEIVLYTSQPDRIADQTIAGFHQLYPKVDVQVFRSGTTEVVNKLMAEFMAGDPKADVVFIADAVSMEALKAGGHLMAYPDADVSAFPKAAYDKDMTYFGTKLITTGIVYNTAAARPTSWLDLLDPALKGKVVLPSPLYSGAAAINMAALDSDPALGRDYYGRLARNGAAAVPSNGNVLREVANGQKMYGVLVEFMALNAKRQGSPVDFVFPKEGVAAITEPIAILKNAHHPEAAQAFVDFILSKQGQELAAKQGFLPARTDVAPPAGFPKPGDVRLLPIDMTKTVQAMGPMRERFTDLFGG